MIQDNCVSRFLKSEGSSIHAGIRSGHDRTAGSPNVDSAEEIVDGLRKEQDGADGSSAAAADGGIRYDGSRGSCVNVALDVKYRVFWRGSAIVRVEKDVLLGELAFTAAKAERRHVTQRFSTSFFHEPEYAPTRQVLHTSGKFCAQILGPYHSLMLLCPFNRLSYT